ncbi:hypothetical protein B0A48_18793 [Cryoendolithus antarcticus]|uniref:Uncharacterized protein n=1 Tax=Cryoendolithus antarcticus TaxID=1507870 RepID=A0A1V8S7M0_9PEZI|nr:hypothetical protein B0A48_18793 [Cryoendolithus antarcticus]
MSPLNYRHQPKLAELSKHSGLKNYPRRIATLFGKAAQARDVLPAHLQGKSRLTILHDYDGEQTFYTNDRKWLPLIADFRKRAVPFVVHEMLLGSDVTPSPTRPAE